jgi:hypothetical protein
MKTLPLGGDAELLTIAARFWTDQAKSNAFYDARPEGIRSDADEAEHQRFMVLHWRPGTRIAELQPTTLMELVAKARLAERFSSIHELAEPVLPDDEALAWSPACDLLVMGEGA